MKKRSLICLLCFVAVICCVLAMTACNPDNTKGCTHDWTEATCESPRTCKLCHAEEGNALGHDWSDPTCQAPATCTRCGKTQGDAAAHSWVENVIPATCTEDGVSEKVCSVCGASSVDVLPATGHSYTEERTEASCIADEVVTYTCACGDTYSQIVAKATGHQIAENATWEVVDATLQAGSRCMYVVTEATQCAKCEESIIRTYSVHKPVQVVEVVSEATCSADGEIRYSCVCGVADYSYTVTVAKNVNAHTWEYVEGAEGITHRCAHCDATKCEVAKSGTVASVSAAELQGENVAIAMTDSQTVLQPDKKLLEQMGDGVEVKVETKSANELTLSDEVKAQIGDTPVYDFSMNKDGAALNFDGGKMTVSVPYELKEGQDPSSVTVLYIDDDGAVHEIEAVYANGNAVFETGHFSLYTVVRLTAAQRCAKLGHEWESVAIPATCTEDGYTVKHCRRCGEFQTINGSKATGHKYVATVVAPTCTSKGYTVYTCSNKGCTSSYTTDFTDMVEHNYAATVVAPTCTKQGYTLHTCSACGKSYKDTYVDAAGHKFVNGVCTICGEAEDIGDINFYFKVLEGIDLSEGFSIVVENFHFALGGYNNVTTECSLAQFMFRIDENGYIVGKGEGKTRMLEEGDEYWTDAQVVFANGKIYVKATLEQDGEKTTTYSVSSQEEIMTEEMREEIAGYIDTYYTAAIEKVLNLIANQKDSPINGAIAKVVEYVFDKKETDEGYDFTLNFDRLKEVATIVSTENGEEIFNRVFGKGAYRKTMDWLFAFSDKTVDELKAEVLGWILTAGVPADDLFAAVNSVLALMTPEGAEPITVQAILSEYGETKVMDLLAGMLPPDFDLDEILNSVDGMLADPEMPIADLIYGLILRNGGGEDPVGPQPRATQGVVAGMLEQIGDVIDAILAIVKDEINVTVSTTERGKLLGFAVSVGNFYLDLSEMDLPVTISVSGKIDLVMGGEINADYSQIVKYIDSHAENMKFEGTKTVIDRNGDKYVLYHNENGVLMYHRDLSTLSLKQVMGYKFETLGEETIDGVECTKLMIRDMFTVYTSTNGIESIHEDCVPNVGYSIDAVYNRASVIVWWDSKTGTVVKSEIAELERWGSSSFYVYYNTLTKEFYGSTQHNFVLIKEHIPTVCEEEGYRIYRCSNCGYTKKETWKLWHETMQRFELKDAKAGCAGGVIATAYCTVCGKDISRDEIEGIDPYTGEHRTFGMVLDTIKTKCGTMYVRAWQCACGEVRSDIEVGPLYGHDGCEIGYYGHSDYCETLENGLCVHGYYEHRIETRRCAVEGCGFSYIVEDCYKKVGQCQYSRDIIYTVNGHTYTREGRVYSQHEGLSSEDKIEGNRSIEEQRCSACGKLVRKYTREIITYQGENYYRDLERVYYEENRRTTFEYNGCLCTITEYYGNDNAYDHVEMMHVYKWLNYTHSTCSQCGAEGRVCIVCGEQDVEYYEPSGHYFEYDSEIGMYVCWRCGTKSETSANGAVVLEDMGMAEDGTLVIGYANWYNRDMMGELYLNTNEDSILLSSLILEDTMNFSGIIRINLIELFDRLQNDNLMEDAESVSVVIATQLAPNYKDPYPDTMEYSLTFSMEELAMKLVEVFPELAE